MSKPTVYLAGPILGLTGDEANDWRYKIAARLAEANIIGVSPLRCEPLIGKHYAPQYNDPKFGTARAIGSKNMFDVRACDMSLIYLPKPAEGRHQSYGTLLELGWAFAWRRLTVLVTDDPEIRSHPVVNFCANWVLDDLEDAVTVIISILSGYNGGKNV